MQALWGGEKEGVRLGVVLNKFVNRHLQFNLEDETLQGSYV